MHKIEERKLPLKWTLAVLLLSGSATAMAAEEKNTGADKEKYLSTQDEMTVGGKTFRLDAKSIIEAERKQAEKKLLSRIIELNCKPGEPVLPENRALCGKQGGKETPSEASEKTEGEGIAGLPDVTLPGAPAREEVRANTYRLLGIYGFDSDMRAELWVNGKKRLEVAKNDQVGQFLVLDVTESGVFLRSLGNPNGPRIFLRIGAFLR